MNPLVGTIIELTDRVQAAIDGGDWSQAQVLETERRRLLEQLAASGVSKTELEPTLAELAARNQRLIGLVQHHRRRVLREAAVAQSAHAGAAVYAAADPSA
jgi:hypothetical protein